MVTQSVNTVLQCGPVLLPKDNPTGKYRCTWEAIVYYKIAVIRTNCKGKTY